MEPVTQALLGAATAELVAGRRLPGRALGWGAVVGMSPDLDVLLGPLHGGYGEWLYHRGTTHSLWFGFVAGPLIGWLLWRWRDPQRETPLDAWISLGVVALLTHPLLDGFTPYGTQFFAPFLRERYAWNGVAIVDPFYSMLLGAGVAAAGWRTLSAQSRRRLLCVGLGVSTCYLLIGLAIGRWVVHDLRRTLASEGLAIERIRAYPTIFQPWLRSFVAHTADTTVVGLHSWQEARCPAWRVHPRRDGNPAAQVVAATWEGRLLAWFADGDTVTFVQSAPSGLRRVRIEDVRYSWASPDGRGMWGLEARVDRAGRVRGGVHRIARAATSGSDLRAIAARLGGRLPPADRHWQRPTHCLTKQASHSGGDRNRVVSAEEPRG